MWCWNDHLYRSIQNNHMYTNSGRWKTKSQFHCISLNSTSSPSLSPTRTVSNWKSSSGFKTEGTSSFWIATACEWNLLHSCCSWSSTYKESNVDTISAQYLSMAICLPKCYPDRDIDVGQLEVKCCVCKRSSRCLYHCSILVLVLPKKNKCYYNSIKMSNMLAVCKINN